MMKKILPISVLFALGFNAVAQTDGVLIDYAGTARDNSAVLEVNSTNQGVLVPRLTLVQRNAIASPAHSLMIYQTDNTPGYYFNSGTPLSPVWQRFYPATGSEVLGSGSATRVAFWDGANSLSSNSNLYWDNTNSRLGIGTLTPNSALQLQGDRFATFGPNSTWGATLRVGGNGNVDNNASVAATNGNLHLDAANGGFATYINFYRGTSGIVFGNGASASIGSIDNTGYLTMSNVINSGVGYRVGGAAASGSYLRGNGTNFVSSAIQAADIPTGSGNYIQNQFGSVQSANFDINGTGRLAKLKFYGEGVNSGVANDSYAIYQEAGSWSHPYPDLAIGFHTGIKLGAHFSYNGIRFYNNSDFATQTFSVGDGDNNIRVYYNIATVGDIVSNQNYGLGLVGLYDSYRYQNVFSMGAAYRLAADGSSTGNMYGLAWTHSNVGGQSKPSLGHQLLAMSAGTTTAAMGNGFWTNYASYLPYIYDTDNTAYYLDPTGTSNMSWLTTNTHARWGEPRWRTNREAYTTDQNYWTGTNGWGTGEGTWANAWKGGFSGWDIWGGGTDHPQGAGYIHAQGIVSGQHYASSDGGSAYGWMMVGASNATDNRYWLRGKWGGTTSGWTEMMTSSNISGNAILNQNAGAQGANFWVSGNGRTDGGMVTGANGTYNTFYTWTNLPNHAGFYSSNHNGAHFYPNNGSYGAWKIDGNRNGWLGIEFGGSAQATSLMMGTTGQGWGNQTTGVHNNGVGWLWRFEHQTLYAARFNDNDNAGYYVDPNSSTRITGDNWLGDASGMVRIGHNWSWNYCVGGWYCCSWDWWGNCNGNCWDPCQSTATHLKLSVHGAAESLGWWGWSDGRFKENVSTVTNALSLVKQMRGVTYDWKNLPETYDEAIKAMNKMQYDPASSSDATGREGFRSQVGVIAQELKEVLPMAVMEVEDKDSTGAVIGTHFSVNYDNVIPVLIEAIKEQQQQIEELKMLIGSSSKESGAGSTGYNEMFKAMRERAAGMDDEVKQVVEEIIVKLQDGLALTPAMKKVINDFITKGTIPERP